MDALKNLVLSLLTSALLSFDTMLQNAETVLTNGLPQWSTVVALSNALKPFCYVVIGICLLIELAQVASKVDIIKWEHGLKICVKMVLSRLCIDVAPTFLRACYNQSTLWVQSVASSGAQATLGATASSTLNTIISNVSGLWSVLGLLITSLLLIVAIKVCGILIEVIAYGRIFEIYVYLLVSPLPCAFFPLGDGTGSGMSRVTTKFFKNFIAVCLQGVMMILCLRIFNIVVSSEFTTLYQHATNSGSDSTVIVSDLCYAVLLFAIVLVMAVAKCGSWAKSIMDAM